MRSTESAIISSYPTSVSGIIVAVLITKPWIRISKNKFIKFIELSTQPALSFAVSFHIWTNYRIGEESQSDYQIVEFRGQFPYLDKLQEKEESQ